MKCFIQLDEQQEVFQGKKFAVVKGKKEGSQRDVVVHPGAVLILPLYENNKIVMIRNKRFAVNETLWELPAGTREKEESSLETAERELLEETGYKAEKIEPLLSFYTSPGFCDEKMDCYTAKDLSYLGQRLDEEEIETFIKTSEEIRSMILTGEIRDGKTIAALLYYWYSQT